MPSHNGGPNLSMPRDHEYIIEQFRSWLRTVYRQHRDLSLLEEITTVGTDACTKVRSQFQDPPPVPESMVPAEVRAEIDDLSGRNIRLTRSLQEARTEIATLKKRLTTAQSTAAEATKKNLPSHQGPATPTTRRTPKRERCKCRGEVENCHFCYGSGWVGGGYR